MKKLTDSEKIDLLSKKLKVLEESILLIEMEEWPIKWVSVQEWLDCKSDIFYDPKNNLPFKIDRVNKVRIFESVPL